MTYKACIFDFDLTLADSTKGIFKCYKQTLEKFGYSVPSDEEIFKTIGYTLLDGMDMLTGIKNNPQREEMKNAYVKYADDCMVKETVFFDDSLAILQILQTAGIKVGIVSTKLKYRIVDTFKDKTSSIPVDEIIGYEEVSSAKPDPEGLNLMVEKLKVDKADVLYIGDSHIDAQTAVNAGVDFAGVTTGTATKQVFEKYPHVCIAGSLTELFTSI